MALYKFRIIIIIMINMQYTKAKRPIWKLSSCKNCKRYVAVIQETKLALIAWIACVFSVPLYACASWWWTVKQQQNFSETTLAICVIEEWSVEICRTQRMTNGEVKRWLRVTADIYHKFFSKGN